MRMAMMAITTNNSISVKARRLVMGPSGKECVGSGSGRDRQAGDDIMFVRMTYLRAWPPASRVGGKFFADRTRPGKNAE
jgi:hypothetical protein